MTAKLSTEVIETCRLARWGEAGGLLLSRNRFMNIGNVIQMLKPAKEGISEVTEICRLVR
jgi:hypothetical protein